MVFIIKFCVLFVINIWFIYFGLRFVNKVGVGIFFYGKVRNLLRVDNVVRGNKKVYFFFSRNN